MFEVLLFYLDLELQTLPRVGKNKSLVLRSDNSEWNCLTQNAFLWLHKNCIHQLFLSYHVSIKDSYHLIFTWLSRSHSVCSLLSIGQVENRQQLPRHLRQRKSVSASCLLLKSPHFVYSETATSAEFKIIANSFFLYTTTKSNGVYNHFHNILRLFDMLPNFPFTASETMRDYY